MYLKRLHTVLFHSHNILIMAKLHRGDAREFFGGDE